MQGVQIRSLVGELGSLTPHGAAKTNKQTKNPKSLGYQQGPPWLVPTASEFISSPPRSLLRTHWPPCCSSITALPSQDLCPGCRSARNILPLPPPDACVAHSFTPVKPVFKRPCPSARLSLASPDSSSLPFFPSPPWPVHCHPTSLSVFMPISWLSVPTVDTQLH